jgi:hypothetical protein
MRIVHGTSQSGGYHSSFQPSPVSCSERLVSGHRDLEIAADLLRKELLDLAMPRHGGDLPTVRVHINRMAAAFPEKTTAMRFEMPHEIDTLHARPPLRRPAARE